jgi:hypothetical protein
MKMSTKMGLEGKKGSISLAKLKEGEKRFRVTFEQAAGGIAHVGTIDNFIRINKKYCDMNISEMDVPSFLISDEIIESLSMQNGCKKEINQRG